MRDEGGFTLLETIVALAILGLLALALAGALRLGGRAWDLNYQRLEDWRQIRAVQDLLRRTLTQAYPLRPADDDRVVFSGGADSLTVITPMPSHLALGAYDVVRIAKARDDLVAEWNRFDPETASLDLGPDSRRVVLLERVAGVRFDYFGSDQPGVRAAWTSDWRGRRALPELVRVQVRFADGAHRSWPEMLVHPMIDGQAIPR